MVCHVAWKLTTDGQISILGYLKTVSGGHESHFQLYRPCDAVHKTIWLALSHLDKLTTSLFYLVLNLLRSMEVHYHFKN